MLTSPEMTLRMTQEQRIVFGSRSSQILDNDDGTWNNGIPAQGQGHWKVTSKQRFINDNVYDSSSQMAIFDTGAMSCYLDDEFVDKVYDLIPGWKKDRKGYYMFPMKTVERIQRELQVALDFGGVPFVLEHLLDDGSTKYKNETDGEDYRRGVIQPKSIIKDGGWTGPDIIGRAVLVSMELNFQFPKHGQHLTSWKRKSKKSGIMSAHFGVAQGS
ncbi:hypothetical protein B0H12DRAFT_840272 [Mycena haematopus]|nr:hypothetical protein B0H12DRAFT_840272 [Mycena haematopus]